MITKDRDFDWKTGPVIAKEQYAVAAYVNARGEVVLRQEDSGFDEGDTLIFLTAQNAECVARALMELARQSRVQTTGAPLAGVAAE
jgi:hypothetical protein